MTDQKTPKKDDPRTTERQESDKQPKPKGIRVKAGLRCGDDWEARV